MEAIPQEEIQKLLDFGFKQDVESSGFCLVLQTPIGRITLRHYYITIDPQNSAPFSSRVLELPPRLDRVEWFYKELTGAELKAV